MLSKPLWEFYKKVNTEEAIANRVISHRKRYESERRRIMFGLEQKTKIHVRTEPRERLLQRNRLQRMGYIVDEKALVAYWTEGTHRATRLEKLKRGQKQGKMWCFYDFAELPEKL